MGWEEKQNDMASSACHTLANFPSDMESHEAFEALGAVPESVRLKWMAEYGIPPAAYEAWLAVQKAKGGK